MSRLIFEIAEARHNGDYELANKLETQQEKEELTKAIDNLSRRDMSKFTDLIKDYARMESWIKSLQEENKKLKEDSYKDEELAKMKTELDRMKSEYYRGFPISEKEHDSIKKWKTEHEKKHKGGYGVSGGKYTYYFVPTSIGTAGVIECSCGKNFQFQEIG